MAKFCVFCGERPESKTKEHVIPKWLIELTGDPKREAFFFYDFSKDPPRPRTFSFDSFAFPACQECNNSFSDLEDAAKSVFERMLNGTALSCVDLSLLLDWLDKVRVGLWLGFVYLDKNMWEIEPKYYIRRRVGLTDRAVIIYETDYPKPTLNFMGPESPGFQHSPVSFALVVNNLGLVNVSHLGLCDRRLGFPYLELRHGIELGTEPGGKTPVSIKPGMERILSPVIRGRPHRDATGLYQPVFRQAIEQDEARPLFETPYVVRNSLDFSAGLGWVFSQKNATITSYPTVSSIHWQPPMKIPLMNMLRQARQLVFETQVQQLRGESSMLTDPAIRRAVQWKAGMIKRINNLMGAAYDKSYERLY